MSSTNPRWTCPYCSVDVLVSRFYFHQTTEHPLQFWELKNEINTNYQMLMIARERCKRDGTKVCPITFVSPLSTDKKREYISFNPLNETVYKLETKARQSIEKDKRPENERKSALTRLADEVEKRYTKIKESQPVAVGTPEQTRQIENLLLSVFMNADADLSSAHDDKVEAMKEAFEMKKQIKEMEQRMKRFERLVEVLQISYSISDDDLDYYVKEVKEEVERETDDDDEEFEEPEREELTMKLDKHKAIFPKVIMDYNTLLKRQVEERKQRKLELEARSNVVEKE